MTQTTVTPPSDEALMPPENHLIEFLREMKRDLEADIRVVAENVAKQNGRIGVMERWRIEVTAAAKVLRWLGIAVLTLVSVGAIAAVANFVAQLVQNPTPGP